MAATTIAVIVPYINEADAPLLTTLRGIVAQLDNLPSDHARDWSDVVFKIVMLVMKSFFVQSKPDDVKKSLARRSNLITVRAIILYMESIHRYISRFSVFDRIFWFFTD